MALKIGLKGIEMTDIHDAKVVRLAHGHNQVAAAIFVSSLILSAAILLGAELMKPERYEFHPGATTTTYVIYDKDTGRATVAEFDSKSPTDALKK